MTETLATAVSWTEPPERAARAVTISAERPDQPEVRALLDRLDAYLAGLYPPEANHILDVPALLAPEVLFLVARVDGRAVGTAAVRSMPAHASTGGQAYGEIKRMFVEPGLRGLGIGRRLLAALEQHLLASGLRLALLETGALQQEAVRLYEAAGYTLRPAFGGYPDNGLSAFYGKAWRPAHDEAL